MPRGSREADTPELLVRAGVDGSRVVLVGAAPDRSPHRRGRRCAVHRAVPAERGLRGAGRRPVAAARQPVGSGDRSGRHPPGGPDRHGRHRQDPARRRVRPPAPGRLPGRHLLDRRGRAAGRRFRPAGDRSPPAVGRDRPAPRRADPGGVRGAGRPTGCAAGARQPARSRRAGGPAVTGLCPGGSPLPAAVHHPAA